MLEAPRLVAVDMNERKLAVARELGATSTVNAASPDAAEQVRELTGGGVEFAFEMAGPPRAARARLPHHGTGRHYRERGALAPAAAVSRAFTHLGLVAEERTIKGSYLGKLRAVARPSRATSSGTAPGTCRVDRLLSERLRLEGINAAFDRLAAGESIRQVVELD